MKAKSIHGNTSDEIKLGLEQSTADGFTPCLAIVFISIKQDRQDICEILDKKGIDFIGATSSGEFCDGYEGHGSTVILLLDLDKDAYAILFEDIGNRNLSDTATHLARNAQQIFERPAFILCSTGMSTQGEMFDGETLIKGILKILGPDIKIIGGMAGDDVTFTGTYVFSGNSETDLGIAALVLDESKISVQGMAVSGWKPIGIERTATKCEDGWLQTIDDQPALDMYLKYLGREQATGEDKHEIFKDTSVHYPFQVEGINDPVMRTPFLVDKDKGAIKLDFDIPEGTKFRFSMPPDFDIVDNILAMANKIKDESQEEAEALLIFSCAGRLNALGPMTKQENEGLSELWKVPMAGFYTYGEYGNAALDKHAFHSTTICWVALKEKEISR